MNTLVPNKYLYIVILSTLYTSVHAKIGCMDNSLHLKEPYDTKTYHYVQCDCPCRFTLSRDLNQCTRCKHAHDAQLFILIKTKVTTADQTTPIFEDVHTVMKRLVQKQLKKRITRP